jgi:hypothetical protein
LHLIFSARLEAERETDTHYLFQVVILLLISLPLVCSQLGTKMKQLCDLKLEPCAVGRGHCYLF